MSSTLLNLYQRCVLQRPLLSLLLVLGVVVMLVSQLDQLKLDASADSLVLEGDTALEFFRENSERYASEEFLIITFQPEGDLLADDSLLAIAALRDELSSLAGVTSVTTILDVPLLESPPVGLSDVTGDEGLPTLSDPGIDRELVRAEFRNSPIYHELLVSEDGRTAAIQVNLERDNTYIDLLKNRESLRAAYAAGVLDAAGELQLQQAETVFRDYASAAAERQSLLVEQVRATVDRYRDRAQLFVGGVPMIAADMVTFVKSDLVTFGSGILLFMVVVLGVIFRGVRWVVMPLVTCVMVAAFMLGLLAALDWRMTVISSNFVALLLIITLAVAIHLMVRFRELQLDYPDYSQQQLVLETVRLMAIPCLYTSLTTAVAFVSLVVSGIRPVIDFGWMMTAGIAAALVLTFILLPSMLALLPKGKPIDERLRNSGLTVRFAGFAERNGALILGVSLIFAAISAVGISRLQVENRFIDYFHDSTEIYQGMELLDAELGGTIPLDIIINLDRSQTDEVIFAADPGAVAPGAVAPGAVAPGAVASETDAEQSAVDDAWADDSLSDDDAFADSAFADDGVADDGFADDGFGDEDNSGFDDEFDSGFDDDAFGSASDTGEEAFVQSYWFTVRGMNQLERVHDYIDSLPETGKVLSLATTYDVVKKLLGNDVGDVELALVQKSLPADIKNLMVAPYFSEDIEQARISLRVKETSRELRRDEFLKNLRTDLVNDLGIKDEQLQFTGMLVLYNNMLQSLFRSQILTIGAVFVAIMVMFLVLFRSLSLALIAIAPNLLAAAIVMGGMGWAGIPLDIMTITIAAIVVGIGVDHAIHYVHRFMREFPSDRNYLATMYRCHQSIGRALYYTSVTVIAGFSILALSNFNPSIYFGLLTGLAMLAAVVGSLLLLPRLILLFKPLGPEAQS